MGCSGKRNFKKKKKPAYEYLKKHFRPTCMVSMPSMSGSFGSLGVVQASVDLPFGTSVDVDLQQTELTLRGWFLFRMAVWDRRSSQSVHITTPSLQEASECQPSAIFHLREEAHKCE